jgi:hypothetical protein
MLMQYDMGVYDAMLADGTYSFCTSDRYGVVRLLVRTRARHRVCNKLIIISAPGRASC